MTAWTMWLFVAAVAVATAVATIITLLVVAEALRDGLRVEWWRT